MIEPIEHIVREFSCMDDCDSNNGWGYESDNMNEKINFNDEEIETENDDWHPIILFNYASRSRKENFFRGLDSVYSNLLDKDNFFVQCTFDEDDVMNSPEVRMRLVGYKNLTYYYGWSQNKIHAINRHCKDFPNADIIVNMSDDFVFTSLFFDRIIREIFKNSFTDTDGFLHFHDGNQNRLATMSVIGRAHFERTGLIYPSDYISVYCDNHAQCFAQAVGKYRYAGDDVRIMNHLHPVHGKAEYDAQYLKTEDKRIYYQDRATFLKHEANNFGLPK